MNWDPSLAPLHALKVPDLIRPLALGVESCPEPRQDLFNPVQRTSTAFIPSTDKPDLLSHAARRSTKTTRSRRENCK